MSDETRNPINDLVGDIRLNYGGIGGPQLTLQSIIEMDQTGVQIIFELLGEQVVSDRAHCLLKFKARPVISMDDFFDCEDQYEWERAFLFYVDWCTSFGSRVQAYNKPDWEELFTESFFWAGGVRVIDVGSSELGMNTRGIFPYIRYTLEVDEWGEAQIYACESEQRSHNGDIVTLCTDNEWHSIQDPHTPYEEKSSVMLHDLPPDVKLKCLAIARDQVVSGNVIPWLYESV